MNQSAMDMYENGSPNDWEADPSGKSGFPNGSVSAGRTGGITKHRKG